MIQHTSLIQQIRSLYLGLDNGLQTSPDVVVVCGITSYNNSTAVKLYKDVL